MQFYHPVRDQMDHARHLPCDMCHWYFNVQTLSTTSMQCVAIVSLVSLLVINLHVKLVTCTILVSFSFPTLKSNFEQNEYTMCRNCNPGATFHIILHEKFIIHTNLVNVSFLCYKISRGNILKPIGMLYNAVLVLRQNYTGTMTDPKLITILM